jgi:hypothetical protein
MSEKTDKIDYTKCTRNELEELKENYEVKIKQLDTEIEKIQQCIWSDKYFKPPMTGQEKKAYENSKKEMEQVEAGRKILEKKFSTYNKLSPKALDMQFDF